MIKESRKNRLPPDLFSRNTLFGLLIQYIQENFHQENSNQELKILDIGGFGSKLSWFLPHGTKLTVLDQKEAPSNNKTNYIQGDARKLPFSDNTFDLVLSSDMLEHIDQSDRLKVLFEMVRVSKRFFILAAPFNSIYNQKAEKYINNQFLEYTGQNHPFLIEHIEKGLPDPVLTEEFFNQINLPYLKIGEGNIYNWYLQQLANITCFGEDTKDPQSNSFTEFFNQNLYKLGNFRSPTYRTVFFADKKGEIDENYIQNLISEHNNFHTTTYFEAYKKAFDQVRNIINLKNHQVKITDQKVSDLKVEINRQKQENQSTDQQINLLNSQINEIQAVINEKETEITNLNQKISQIEENFNKKLQKNQEELKLLDKQIRSQDLLVSRLKIELEQSQKNEEELKNLTLLKEQSIHQNQIEITQKNQQIQDLQISLSEYKKELETVLTSNSWKLVRIYGYFKNILYTRPKYLIKTSLQVLFKMGPKEFFKRVHRKLFKNKRVSESSITDYQKFIELNQLSDGDIKNIKKEIENFEYQPMISIVVPVYNVEETWLRKMINSVLNQYYPKWELCLADDASTKKHVTRVLKEYTALDNRIKVQFRSQNGGIVKASNTALKMARGAYIALLDNDDEITPDALFQVVKALQNQRYDLIYSDEDKLELDGTRVEPHFKPDFDQNLLFSCNYICHFSVFRRKIIEEIGGFKEGFDGSQDYDLILRFTEQKRSIYHIPKVLYHWRKVPGSTASEVNAKPYAFESAKKALRNTLKHRNIDAEVEDGIWKGSYRIKREIQESPLVSIIIPFRDKVDILKNCLNSFFEKTTYQNYEILLVNNASELLETREYMREIVHCPRVRLLHYNAPFNFSAINNFAADQAKGKYLILLNNDTEIIAPDWVESLLEHAQRDEVGAVGAKLLYPNNSIQHAGVIIGVGGAANHCFAKLPSDQNGYFGLLNVIRSYSAVTGACVMVKKSVYLELNGLEEENLAVSFNDVDFCLRLREKNYQIVYTPYAVLYHHESLSRGYNVAFNEEYYLRQRHKNIFEKGDPFYNPNLSRDKLDFSLNLSSKVKIN